MSTVVPNSCALTPLAAFSLFSLRRSCPSMVRSALDTLLLPPDNELKKWSVHASARELPLDSTFLLRASQSKLTNSVDLGTGSVATPWNSGLKPTSSATVPGVLQPVGVGYLITDPSASTFNGLDLAKAVEVE